MEQLNPKCLWCQVLPGVLDLFLRPEVPDWMDFVYALVALNAGIVTVFLWPLLCRRLHFLEHHGVHILRLVNGGGKG